MLLIDTCSYIFNWAPETTKTAFLFQQVDDLKAKLAAQEAELAIKNEDANKLISVVGAETEKVGKEKAIADSEEQKVQVINAEVSVKAADCERDLAKAEPALLAAQEALNTLNKVGGDGELLGGCEV